MKISNVRLDAVQIAGNAEGIGLLIGMTAGFDYVDGKRTDNQSHIKYEVVFQDNLYEKEVVKVPGTKPIVTPEQFAQQKGKREQGDFPCSPAIKSKQSLPCPDNRLKRFG